MFGTKGMRIYHGAMRCWVTLALLFSLEFIYAHIHNLASIEEVYIEALQLWWKISRSSEILRATGVGRRSH